jgi:predicted adenylyl cyclase CyaB
MMKELSEAETNVEVKVSKPDLPVFVEFETKYRVDDPKLLWDFKHLVERQLGRKDFLYIQSDDIYYVKSADEFIRYRFSETDKRAELTIKRKTGTGNNIIREETNVRVDGNEFDLVETFIKQLGFSFNFRINKQCHIYHGDDATLVFYSVRDLESNKLAHFIEIEVKEGGGFTEDESWAIIKKYETALAPLGVTPQKRLRKSLFEMYRREK